MTIMVSSQFKKDFDGYCKYYDMSPQEILNWKNAVRSDMEHTGQFIVQYMRVVDWMRETWGYIPDHELLVGYLHEKRVFIDVNRYGVDVLARFCFEIANDVGKSLDQ